MSPGSRAYRLLCKLYGFVLREMRRRNFLMEHGIDPRAHSRPRRARGLAAPPVVEGLEARLLLDASPSGLLTDDLSDDGDVTINSAVTIDSSSEGDGVIEIHGRTVSLLDAGSLAGDGSGGRDNLAITADERVTIEGDISGGGIGNVTIVAPEIVIDGATIETSDNVAILAYAADEVSWSDLAPFYEDVTTETSIEIVSSTVVGNDILIEADASTVRDSNLEVDIAAMSSLVSMTGLHQPRVTFADNGAAADTITRDVGSWADDGFEAGQQIEVSGATVNRGVYTVEGVTDAALTLAVGDELVNEANLQGLSIAERRARLTEPATTNLTFAAADDSITRDVGSWLDDGFVAGQRITISGTSGNDGTYTVASVTAATLSLDEALADEANVQGAVLEGDRVAMAESDDTVVTLTFAHDASIPTPSRAARAAGRGTGSRWDRPSRLRAPRATTGNTRWLACRTWC